MAVEPSDSGMPTFNPGAFSGGGGGGPSKGPTAANALGGNFLAGGKMPVVYWGTGSAVRPNTNTRDSSRDEAISKLGISNVSTIPLQTAADDFYRWSDTERSSFAKRLYGLGMIDDPNDMFGPSGAFAMWQNAVQQASNFYTVAQRKVTPWGAIDIMAGLAGGGQGQGPKTQTSTSRSLNIPNIEDAHAATRTIFQSLLGRDPGNDELDRYSSMITAYAQKHPQTTTSTQTTDVHGNSTSSSTQSGGWTAEGLKDMLAQKAKIDPEYGSYQAATTYYNAMVSALGGTGA